MKNLSLNDVVREGLVNFVLNGDQIIKLATELFLIAYLLIIYRQ